MTSRIAQFQALLDRQPENELFRFSLAQALVADGRFKEAEAHYAFCIAKKADWMMPRILYGKLLIQIGRGDEAKPILVDALRLAVEQRHEEPEKELLGLLADLEP